MPPQNILISLRFAPLHQDILHRGLTNGSIQFILKKERERLISCSYHKVIFLRLIVFTEFFSQSRIKSIILPVINSEGNQITRFAFSMSSETACFTHTKNGITFPMTITRVALCVIIFLAVALIL